MISMNCGILIGCAWGKEVEAMMPTRGEPGKETLIGECFDHYTHVAKRDDESPGKTDKSAEGSHWPEPRRVDVARCAEK